MRFELLERTAGGISCISLFELAWLAKNQRIVLKTSLEAFLVEVETRFLILRSQRPSRASPWSFLRRTLSIPWTELSERPRWIVAFLW